MDARNLLPTPPLRSGRRARDLVAHLALVGVLTAGSGCSLFRGWKKPEPEPERAPVAAPAADASFPDAEPLLAEAMRDWNNRKDLKLVRATFSGNRWTATRSDAGVILWREVQLRAYSSANEKGVCHGFWCALRQEELGGTWGSSFLACETAVDMSLPVTCESVESLPGPSRKGGDALE